MNDIFIACFRCEFLHKESFLLEPVQTTYYTNINSSPVLKDLVFTGYNSKISSHVNHVLHYMPETIAHRQTRLKQLQLSHIRKNFTKSPPHSPTKVCHLMLMLN